MSGRKHPETALQRRADLSASISRRLIRPKSMKSRGAPIKSEILWGSSAAGRTYYADLHWAE